MTRSRLLIRQSIPPVTVTRTRRGAVVELLKRGLPARHVGMLVVLALMIGCAASAVWQASFPVRTELTPAEVKAMEDAAFRAGRETAYEELSQGMAQVYEQGRQDGLAGREASQVRGSTR